ncbi:Coiled-coil domain-containing protein 39 [Borealophlyctis nickersoniae]|nr:Coiled-coil domain-containing protein 39 [Borealophlyctis nickersoniae]
MLSFDDNLHVHSLPPFANEENKALSKEIRDAEEKLSNLLAVLDDNASRGSSMTVHMKNVQQELAHTQALHDAKSRQIETEDHFKQLAEREAGRLALEIKRMEKDIAHITDHLNTLQNNIYRGNERIDAVRTELKLEKEELDEWLRVEAEKEEDNLALLKYSKEDDAKIKELSLGIEKLMVEVNKKKATLSAEVTETQVAQIELDKTTEAFKSLHNERQELIAQWESAIATMHKRDAEIVNAQGRYYNTKEEIKQKQSVIDEKQQFLDQQHAANAETEKRISMCDRSVSKFRLEQSEANASLAQFQDEVEVLRNTLNKTATDLVNKRSEIVNLKGDLQEKQAQLEKERANRANMKEKLGFVMDETMSMEAKAQELQEILKQEELRNKELDRELKILREAQFKRSQDLFRMKQEEKNLSAEIAGGEAALKNLKSKIHRLDQEALKQQALLYAQEFQIQQLERKVRRAQGDRTDEEKEILVKKIEDLNSQLEEQTKRYTLLNSQLKKSQDDLRQSKRTMENLQKEKDTVIATIDELNLYNDSASHQLASKIREKEELMVEENILRLELRKLRGFLNARADEVLSLETRQTQLHLALQERTHALGLHSSMLRLAHKASEEERHSACAELRDRVSKVEKLKRRYEILMTQFAPTEDGENAGEGEEHSQAYYVIKAAQRREELQREGDELDENIRKCEKECRALENTLRIMNSRNEEYRMNLYRQELNSKDVQHKEMLAQQYRQAMERYKQKRAEIQTLQTNLLDLERTFHNTSAAEAAQMQSLSTLQLKLAAMQKEVSDQEEKRNRALRGIAKLQKEVRKGGRETLEEVDFGVRALKEVGNLVLGEVGRVGERWPDVGARVQQLLDESSTVCLLHSVVFNLPPAQSLVFRHGLIASVMMPAMPEARGQEPAADEGAQPPQEAYLGSVVRQEYGLPGDAQLRHGCQQPISTVNYHDLFTHHIEEI